MGPVSTKLFQCVGLSGEWFIGKIIKLPNRAAHIIITHSNYNVRFVKQLKQLNWKTLSQKHICSKTIMMYKVLNGLALNYLREKFSYVSQRHKHTLINLDINLILPDPIQNMGKKCFSYNGWSSITYICKKC